MARKPPFFSRRRYSDGSVPLGAPRPSWRTFGGFRRAWWCSWTGRGGRKLRQRRRSGAAW
ncbi:hypothetical protein Ahy_Scaffold1g106800 isoform H [Arachis hypogaea]|uniref:Uncharacterized protein n=1 Tax=Arachis hypogaea TaxID=3818 RepID=A0A444WSA3_ARAHY|nr:hypothetical protein Ahy_Scaffold1g106800 isoform H [Arachis hypogaea]